MTTGTLQTIDRTRGTGTLRCIAGTLVPFSTTETDLRAGDAVTFRLTGGLAGLYAVGVERAAERVAPARERQRVLSASAFLRPTGAVPSLAG